MTFERFCDLCIASGTRYILQSCTIFQATSALNVHLYANLKFITFEKEQDIINRFWTQVSPDDLFASL